MPARSCLRPSGAGQAAGLTGSAAARGRVVPGVRTCARPIWFPAARRRVYVGRDDGPAGDVAVATLGERGSSAGIEVGPLSPMLGDHNEDLGLVGSERMRAALRPQLVAADDGRFLMASR